MQFGSDSSLRGRSLGPKAHDGASRRAYADRIAARLLDVYGDRARAVLLYGSLARGDDAAYSDIELSCLVDGEPERDIEWAFDGWKAEVWLVSPERYLREAARMSPEWSLTHGAFVDAVGLHDPDALAAAGRAHVFDHAIADYEATIRDVVVGDLYERIAKLRGVRAVGNDDCVAEEAMRICINGLCVVGLANRVVFGSIATRLAESLGLDDRPAGYDALARMVMRGELRDASAVAGGCETFWDGVVAWTTRRGITIEEDRETPF